MVEILEPGMGRRDPKSREYILYLYINHGYSISTTLQSYRLPSGHTPSLGSDNICERLIDNDNLKIRHRSSI